MTNNANEALVVTQADRDLLDAITAGLFDWKPSAKRARLQMIAQFRITSAAVVKQDLTTENAVEVADILGFDTGKDASLNLQGALDDLQGRHKVDDGGVICRTLQRVINQIEKVRALPSDKPLPSHELDDAGKPAEDSDPWFQLGWYKYRLELAERERDEWKERAMSLRLAPPATSGGEASALRIGWWNDMRQRGVSQDVAIELIRQALASG